MAYFGKDDVILMCVCVCVGGGGGVQAHYVFRRPDFDINDVMCGEGGGGGFNETSSFPK